MRCPICHADAPQVIRTSKDDEGATRRRRKCGNCGHRFNTFEVSEEQVLKFRRLQEYAAGLVDLVREG
jgi:transcriptional repressor NrdR